MQRYKKQSGNVSFFTNFIRKCSMEILRRLNWAAEGYAERKFRLKNKKIYLLKKT